ncbi:MAG: hypothetical protein OEY01_00595 [Desulfobulbaceae bacterium]|nr:hypothetical protein [Desulfobulbaceae bacterium]HIJ77790.1 hypothetical protein [Deltaproteobacteria bacterium]
MKNNLIILVIVTLLYSAGAMTPALAADNLDDLDITMEIIGADVENSKEITNNIELPFQLREREEFQHQEQERIGMDAGDNGPTKESFEKSVEIETPFSSDSPRYEKPGPGPKAD